jgi:ADP-heptose:LPS heptosyltransferase
MPAQPLEPIVVWFGRVGDMILLSALLEILHRRYGGRCHVIGAGSWPAEIFAAHSAVARVSCLHRYTAFLFDLEWWRARRALRAARDQPVYVCEYYPRKLARVRRLLRLSGVDPARCLFLTDMPQPPAHWVDRLAAFARLTPPAFRASDYPVPSRTAPPAPRLEVSAPARAECAAWLESRGLSSRPLVLVQPGNRRTMRGRRLQLSAADAKAWPLERWAQLLQRMHAQLPEALLLVCGAPRERLLLEWIVEATRLPCVVAAEPLLPRLFALCERAHSMVSVDTGPAHAAAALSVPIVVLFGAHSQAEWLPRSPTASPVIGLGGPPYSNRLDAIAAESVFAAWCSLPARQSPSPAGSAVKAKAASATEP